jgi:hypothetical protein
LYDKLAFPVTFIVTPRTIRASGISFLTRHYRDRLAQSVGILRAAEEMGRPIPDAFNSWQEEATWDDQDRVSPMPFFLLKASKPLAA